MRGVFPMKTNFKIAIKSCHKYPERRAAQIATWLKGIDEDFFFLIGSPTPGEGGPVICDSMACAVSDSFQDIAPKVLAACRYALDENTPHLFVCDDDTYVCMQRLRASSFWRGDYIGFMRTDTNPSQNLGIPYAQGSAFWLSARSMEWICRNEHLMRPGIIDDGAVGQCLVDKVPFTHDYRYEPGPNPMNERGWRTPMPNNNIISAHKCTPVQMVTAHARWLKRA